MSLRSKVVILLSAVMLAYAAIDHALQRTFVYRTFVALEQADAKKNIDRVDHALRTEIAGLQSDARSWSMSDEVYRLASGSDASAFARLAQRLEGRGIHVMYVCDQQGGHVFDQIRDVRGLPTAVREFPASLHPEHPLLRTQPGAEPGVHGVFMTEKGPLLVAAEPIIGPPGAAETRTQRGYVIMGRFLDSRMCEELGQRVRVSFECWPIDAADVPETAREVIDEASSSGEVVLQAIDEERLSAYLAWSDVKNLPALLIRANLPRDATLHGDWAVRYALFSTIAAGLLMMLVLLNMLQRTVLKPLAQLTQHAVTIGRSDDFTRRIGDGSARQDEVGILTREFDSMIEKVAQSRAALVDTARAAGMSEIATGVLHNVGNVLNSVNVSANLVAARARGGAPEDFKRVVDLLRPDAHDLAGFIQRDPRGQHLYPLLDSLATQLVSEQSTLLQEVQSLTSGIEHIKELVQAQQGYAGRAGVREVLSVQQLIDSAVAITERGVVGSKPIEVVREFQDVEACPVDRHRLMEILVNLIQNARQALNDSEVPKGRITLRLARAGDQGLHIEVEDDGVGIPAENLARVFNHGFTTKKGGHGFGLHASANAATEMDGKLVAQSDGPGRGARFTLEFPVPAAVARGAAA